MIPSIQHLPQNSSLKPQLTQQTQQIVKLLTELKGHAPKSKRSINWLGSAWKWIAGSPDASDWDEILKSQNQIVENNNEQYKINNALMETSQQILNEYNKIIRHLNENSRENFEQITFNRLLIIKEEIKEIVRAAQLAKGEIINTNLLNKEEINRVIAEIETLPYSNEIEAIEYAKPIMLAKGSSILYVMSIPKTSRIDYDHILIRSTIKENKQIHLEYQELLANQNKLFGIIAKCRTFKETIICETNQLKEINNNHCINQLMKGQHAKCDYQINTGKIIESLNENTIFLNNFNGNLTHNNSIQHLEGNILIQYYNETLEIDNKTFSNGEVKMSQILPPILQNNITEKSIKIDLSYLHNLHLRNVAKLERLVVNHKTSIFVNIGIAITVILGILFVIIKPLRKTYGSLGVKPKKHQIEETIIQSEPQPIILKF